MARNRVTASDDGEGAGIADRNGDGSDGASVTTVAEPETATATSAGAETTASPAKRTTESGRRQTLYNIRVFCIGTKPYLANRYDRQQMINDLIFKIKHVPDTETPVRERAAKTIHRDSAGRICMTRSNLMGALCGGGCSVTLRGRVNLSKKDGRVSLVPNFLDILGSEYIPLLLPDGRQATDTDWVEDVRRAIRDDNTNAPCRARFDAWAFLVDVRVDLSKVTGLTLETVRKLFDAAGASCGIGAYRREFGKFVVADGGWIVTPVDQSMIERPKAPAHLMGVPGA